MDALENLVSTADPAFACDRKGVIVAWNESAEGLLGYPAADVIGRKCYLVLGGKDVFGNRFCDERCAIRNMINRHEPVRHFQLSYRTESSQRVDVSVSVFVVFGTTQPEFNVVHVLEPLKVQDRGDISCIPDEPTSVNSPPKIAKSGHACAELTIRETEVLRILAEGLNTTEVADRLCISEATVRNHIRNILSKLGVHSRLEAVCLAIDQHLI